MDGADTMRIVIMGKSESGKSSLANTMFGEKVFTISHILRTETITSRAKTKSVNGRSLTLIDTPGFFDTDRSEEDLKPEITRCLVESSPGPHAFLIVLKVEKFTEDEQAVIDKIQEYFSEDVFKFATVVFTHGDQLLEGQIIENFAHQNKSLSDLLKKCGNRCHVIDNKHWNKKDEYRSNEVQVEKLLSTIDKMVTENNGRYYTAPKEAPQPEGEDARPLLRNISMEVMAKQPTGTACKNLFMKMADITTGASFGALFGVLIQGIVAAAGASGMSVSVLPAAFAAVGALIGGVTRFFRGSDTRQ